VSRRLTLRDVARARLLSDVDLGRVLEAVELLDGDPDQVEVTLLVQPPPDPPEPRRLFPWPATLGGEPRSVGPFTGCSRCASDAHPVRRGTFVKYGGTPLCLPHSIAAEAAEGRTS
jgi:hypothetical protein